MRNRCTKVTEGDDISLAAKPAPSQYGLFVGFEVLTAVVMKSTIFRNIHVRSCSHLVCSAYHLLSRCFLARLTSRPWRWRRYVFPKCLLTFNGLHGVISQKIILFMDYSVRASHHICYSEVSATHIHTRERTEILEIHNRDELDNSTLAEGRFSCR
jgi:hypothetical protein